MKDLKNRARESGIKIMARLITLLGSLAYVMVVAVINGSLGFCCSMGVTVFGATAVAKALGEPIAMSYALIAGLAVGLGVLRGILRYFEQYSNHYIAFRLLAVLRDKIFGALRVLCPAKLESKKKGSIIAMITSDIETLEVFYAHTVSPVCIAIIVSTAVFLFVGFVSGWYLALVALAGFIVVGITVPLISSKVLKNSGVRYRAEFASFNAFFLDSIKGIKETVLANAGEKRKEQVNKRSASLSNCTKEMKRDIVNAQAFTELAVSLMIIASTAVAVAQVVSGSLSIGKAVIGVVAIFGAFGPVIAISALPGNLTQTFASGDRVLKLLNEKPVTQSVNDGCNVLVDDVKTVNLNFSYGQQQVLKDVCMHAKRGEIVGIVGESGCGKSTLLKLLMRFWQKDGGKIFYNGVDIDRINSDNLTDNVTLISQSTYLFDETIEENLRIANEHASKEELEFACRQASVHDFLMSLPQGYATRAGALGDNLSAGERQRIGLARAFLCGSGLILLDEPTSNVDSINEGIILKSIAAQRRDKAIILVSHRESTMAIADRVYRMDKGILTEVTKGE